MNDLSLESAQNNAAAYNLSNQEFIEYLRTLGIRTYEGTGANKKAFSVVKDNLQQRGW